MHSINQHSSYVKKRPRGTRTETREREKTEISESKNNTKLEEGKTEKKTSHTLWDLTFFFGNFLDIRLIFPGDSNRRQSLMIDCNILLPLLFLTDYFEVIFSLFHAACHLCDNCSTIFITIFLLLIPTFLLVMVAIFPRVWFHLTTHYFRDYKGFHFVLYLSYLCCDFHPVMPCHIIRHNRKGMFGSTSTSLLTIIVHDILPDYF